MRKPVSTAKGIDEYLGKERSRCRHRSRSFNPRLLCSVGIPWSCGPRERQRVGAAAQSVAVGRFVGISMRRLTTALLQEILRQKKPCKFQKVFRSSPIPFSITTLKEGRFLDVNRAFEHRYGYSREEVLGRTVHDLKIWEDPADRVRMLSLLQKSGPIRNVVTRLRTKSGQTKLTAYSADRIQFDGQSCILAVSEDLPEYDKGKVN